MDDFLRRSERFPVVLMALRLLDQGARYDPNLRSINVPTRPYATRWLSLLGDLLHERRGDAKPILYDFERKSTVLAERLESDYPEAAAILRNNQGEPSVVWRLAEALTLLQGRKSIRENMLKMIDSAQMSGRPNGLASKRTVIRKTGSSTASRRRDLRSLVFTDSVLDYLVHLQVLRQGNKGGTRPLSFKDFVRVLHDRYGFCVDEAPLGMTISNDLLQLNRAVLEHRLRDLGLLVGVNDAEAMKRLRPRFESRVGSDDGLD